MKRGKSVILFVLNESYFFLSHRSALARAAQEAGFEVHVAAPPDHVWAPPGFNVSELVDAGYCFHAFPLSRRGQRPWEELRTLWALVRLYRVLRPDLVHHLTIKAIIYGGLAARLVRVPAVVNAFTGLGQIFVARGPWWTVLRVAISQTLKIATAHFNSCVILQNPEDRQLLIDRGIVTADRSIVIRGSGVDLKVFKCCPEVPPGPPVVILAARMIFEKGIAEFVAAARILKRDGVEARFVLVGDTQPSNPRAVPLAQLQAWGAEGIVEYWGRRDDMAEVLRQCHVVCLPSKYGEGVPRVLIEAAAVGRPMVATGAPGCREVVRHGQTGLLVPPGDADALASAIALLVKDRDLRARMGAKAHSIAVLEFDERITVTQTLDVYDRLLVDGAAQRERMEIKEN